MTRALVICGALCVCTAAGAETQSRRALFVGSNAAPAGLTPLRYAHSDAKKMRDVFVELGGLAPENAELLLNPNAEALRRALEALRSHGGALGQQLIFYYSGHSDGSGLRLGQAQLPFSEVRAFLRDERAQVRVAFLDSCRSGAVSQTKGGQVGPGVDIRWASDPPVKGAVLITSSTAEEASVERDDIGGSLFSHFFVSGMRGAADGDEDGKVTLEEAFDYAYNHTLARSTESRSGTQHPTYEYRIAGQQQLVLSWLTLPSYVSFGADVAGAYVVFDRDRHQVVAEITKRPGTRRRLWLPAGDYYIKKRLPSAVLLQKVGLAKGSAHVVRDHEMHTVPYEEDVTKGHLSEVFRPTWKYGAPYLPGTANTMRRGEVSVGLLTLNVGLSDDVTLTTSPLADLLMVPNLSVKLRLVQGESLIWSGQIGFSQSYWERIWKGQSRSQTELGVDTALSWLMVPSLTLSLLAGWEMESRPDHESGAEWESQLVRGGASVTWLLGENDLIQLVAEGQHTFLGPQGTAIAGSSDWGGSLQYAHAWEIFRLSVGVARRSAITRNLEMLPTYTPTLDLWWRW